MSPAARIALPAAALLAAAGCYDDYTPVRGYVDSPSTISIEQEDRLIADGEQLLRELDLQDVAQTRQAGKSFGQVSSAEQKAGREPPRQVDPLPESPWVDPSRLPLESWEVQYLGGRPMGYVHRQVKRLKFLGVDQFVTEVDATASVVSGKRPARQQTTLSIFEEPDGALERVDAAISVAGRETKIEALVLDKSLRVSVSGAGARELPIEHPVRGPFAVDQSLTARPMGPGEQRLLRVYDPTLSQPVLVHLTARGNTQVALPGGRYADLLEIEVAITSGEQTVRSAIWSDAQGRILKRYFPYLKLTAYAADRDEAEAVRDAAALAAALEKTAAAEMSGPAGDPARPQAFRVALSERDPFEVFPRGGRQSVESINGFSADIRLAAADASQYAVEDAVEDAAENAAGDDLRRYAEAGGWIASDDPAVRRLAEEFREGEGPLPLRIAGGLAERFELRPFEGTVRPLGEVAGAKAANAFELAMLAAAAARASGLPARVAIGYSASASPRAMTPHAWAEVRVGGRWLGVDPTRPGGLPGTDTIKLSDTAADDRNPYAPILAAYRLLPQLQIQAKEEG